MKMNLEIIFGSILESFPVVFVEWVEGIIVVLSTK